VYPFAVRTRSQLTGELAHLLQRIVLDGARFDPPALPPVVGGHWGDKNLDGMWGPLRVEGPGVDYDVGRIDILRSLFVALMARACRYDGAIAGWVTDNAAAWKPQPDWWPAPSEATLAEARVAYTCER